MHSSCCDLATIPCFFLLFNPNFCKYRHIAVLVPNFQSDEQIIHTTLPKWHLDAAPPKLARSSFAFVKRLNCGFPLCLGCKFSSVCCCFTSFCTQLLLTANTVATFLIDIFYVKCAATIFYAHRLNMLSLAMTFKMIFYCTS